MTAGAPARPAAAAGADADAVLAALDPAPVVGVYIHWPFCVTKCPYCDFNSHVARTGGPEQWAAAYRRAIAAWRARLPGARLASVFFGGGTPSLMPVEVVGAVLDALVAAFPPVDGRVEVTLEANPTSVEARRFAGYRAAGVNRVSLGIQALDDAALRLLGRPHDRAEALAAFAVAARHFARVNIDLIYARPGQTPDAWARELEHALGLGAGHMSCYQLTLEPGTRFWSLARRGRLALPDGEATSRMFAFTRARLADADLPAYEVSNHARPGEECRHNLVYWRYGAWIGIGPGAHGRLPLVAPGAMLATAALRDPAAWLRKTLAGDGLALASLERLEPATAAREALLMGLRLAEGVELAQLEARFGLPTSQMLDVARARALAAEGLVRLAGGRLAVSERGVALLDRLLAEIVRWRAPAFAGRHPFFVTRRPFLPLPLARNSLLTHRHKIVTRRRPFFVTRRLDRRVQ